MRRLGDIAAEFNCAIVLIGHQNKSQGGKAIYRGLGSIDIAAAARSILVVSEAPETEYRRAVVHVKSSLGAKGQTILFDLDPEQGFVWAGMSDLTDDDVLNYRQTTRRKAPTLNECIEFLNKLLSSNPVPACKVMEAAKANGFSEITVTRAKSKMDIKSIKIKGGKWVWMLKDSHIKTNDVHDNLDSLT